MSRKATIGLSALILATWGLMATLLGQGLNLPQGDAASYLSLLALLSLSAPILLLWRSLTQSTPFRVITFCVLLSLVGTLLAAAWTADFGSAAAFGAVLMAFLAAFAAGLSLEENLFSGRSRGLIALFCALVVLVLPFCLDAKLVQSHDVAGIDRLLTVVCSASPTLTLTDCTPGGFRLLKQRRIYERFRIGEQMLPAIEPTRFMTIYFAAAALLGLLSRSTPRHSHLKTR